MAKYNDIEYKDDFLIREIAEKTSFSIKVVKEIFDAFKETVLESIEAGDEILIKNLFKIKYKKIKPYVLLSPFKEKPIEKDNVVRIVITPSPTMKSALKRGLKKLG